MRALLALALVWAACDVTHLEVPPPEQEEEVTGRWVSDWMFAGTDAQGDYSTRYVLQVVEDANGTCTAMLTCECSSPAHPPPVPGNHFWEGNLSEHVITMHSTNLVTGDAGELTASMDQGTLNVFFSWGETVAFTRVAN